MNRNLSNCEIARKRDVSISRISGQEERREINDEEVGGLIVHGMMIQAFSPLQRLLQWRSGETDGERERIKDGEIEKSGAKSGKMKETSAEERDSSVSRECG